MTIFWWKNWVDFRWVIGGGGEIFESKEFSSILNDLFDELLIFLSFKFDFSSSENIVASDGYLEFSFFFYDIRFYIRKKLGRKMKLFAIFDFKVIQWEVT